MKPRGITLIETVIYIGLFMIILPTFVLFLLQIWQTHISLDARSRMEESAALIFLELQNSIAQAGHITTSTSTLANDNGVIKFTDNTGQLVTIDRPAVTINLTGVDQTVHRLRMQKGAAAAVYLTDPEIDVTKWRIDTVKISSTLVGLRFSLSMGMLNPGAAYRKAAFVETTTLALSANTTEN